MHEVFTDDFDVQIGILYLPDLAALQRLGCLGLLHSFLTSNNLQVFNFPHHKMLFLGLFRQVLSNYCPLDR